MVCGAAVRGGVRRSLGVALVLALAAGCGEPARRLGSGPAGHAGARALVEALALRFGEMEREPAFDALRPKLARAALIPSWVWDDEAAWPRQGETFRAVEFAGYRSGSGYRIGVRPMAPEPAAVGEYRGQLRLDKLASGRFEWTVREELAVGALRPAELAAALDALLRAAQAKDEPGARAAIAAGFPRASAKLGLLLGLERLSLAHDALGATSLTLAVRLAPAGLRPTAPRYAAYLDKYLTPMRTRVVAADAAGATWWVLEGERNLWTLRMRARDGSLVPLEGEVLRGVPGRLHVTIDYATRMGRYGVAARGLLAEVALTRTPVEKGFVAHFRNRPDWDLPFLVEPLLGSPLSYPFEGPGSEAGWAVVEAPAGARFVRHYRARMAENWVLRWLGGMTNRAVGEFRAGAEREADRYHGECLLALRDDLVALLEDDGTDRRTTDNDNGQRNGGMGFRGAERPPCPR
jgi:hypothetical protein